MSETHYLISDASKKVDVESHVLRYWEEELEMNIPRNEMGHRYYTDFHIRLFKQIKELKEKGYQLKAIKTALAKTLDAEGESVAPTDVLEEDVMTALKECTEPGEERSGKAGSGGSRGTHEPGKSGAVQGVSYPDDRTGYRGEQREAEPGYQPDGER